MPLFDEAALRLPAGGSAIFFFYFELFFELWESEERLIPHDVFIYPAALV
jgi:hypothetical protein